MDLPNLLYMAFLDRRFDQSLFPEIHYRLIMGGGKKKREKLEMKTK